MLDDEKFAKEAAKLDLDVPELRNVEPARRQQYLQHLVFELNELSRTHGVVKDVLDLLSAYQQLVEDRIETSVDEALFDRYFTAAVQGSCNGPFPPAEDVIRGAARTAQLAIEIRHEVLNGNRT